MPKSNRQWLLIRGLTRGQFHWCDFPKKLQQKYPNDEIVMIDLPGNGFRNKEDSPRSIAEYTEDLRKQINNKGDLYIIALSFGAMVVIDWIKKYPNEIQKAYLVNTSAKGLTPFYKRLLPQNYITIFSSVFSSKYEREKNILQITSNNLQSQEDNILDFEKYAEKYPIKIENLINQLLASTKFELPESFPGEKIELLVSINDRLVSCENSFSFAKKLNLVPIEHPWAGHDLVLDDPDFVLSKIGPNS